MELNKNKMQVEIWSDIMCPFCYIGKRKFERALEGFSNKDNIEVVWKSYQLAPDMETTPGKTIHQYLSERKGVSIDEAKRMNDYVTDMAAKTGLVYNFDKAVVANSFNAHRLIHLAGEHGKQSEVKEKLLAAYFTEGKNVDDIDILIKIGTEAGLNTNEVKAALTGDTYANEVRNDIDEANQLGVNGVPFFVFNRKYAISGAQETQSFTQALETSFTDWKKINAIMELEATGGPVCTPDGECK